MTLNFLFTASISRFGLKPKKEIQLYRANLSVIIYDPKLGNKARENCVTHEFISICIVRATYMREYLYEN